MPRGSGPGELFAGRFVGCLWCQLRDSSRLVSSVSRQFSSLFALRGYLELFPPGRLTHSVCKSSSESLADFDFTTTS